MSKKQDLFYFENFIACTDCACKAAKMLEETMLQFDADNLPDRISEIHVVEHAADEKKHELLHVLAKAFITPIEREDILLLSQSIDDMVDQIEDVLLRIYCNNIRSIQPNALKMVNVLVRCCEEVKELMEEFADFKRSKNIHDHIVRINSMEEEADKLSIDSLRELHTTSSDPIEVIVWREIYLMLEQCADTCEHVADAVESVIMKNS